MSIVECKYGKKTKKYACTKFLANMDDMRFTHFIIV